MELCPPVFAYGAFMIALGLYDIYMGSFPSLGRTVLYLILGSMFLWILCAAGMDFVAWGLLSIPVMFYVFLFAILIFQKGFDIQEFAKPVAESCKPKEEKEEECPIEEECPVEEETCEESECPDDSCL
jgi:hypothetical protein